jgi:thymidine kinase
MIMAKLYFRHGTVGSAKTLNLLAVAHNYEHQGKRIVLIKPRLDDRYGAELVRSRAGLERSAEYLLDGDSRIPTTELENVDCILVDEAQFLSRSVIEQLRDIATHLNIPVICYGLRTDFRTEVFEGSRRLLELADSIEEVKTTCQFCHRKAVFNLKHVDGVASIHGPVVDLGAEEKYYSVCHSCYSEQLSTAGTSERQLRLTLSQH